MSFPPTPPPSFSVQYSLPVTVVITHRSTFDPKIGFGFVGFICFSLIVLFFILYSYHRRIMLSQTRVYDDIESRVQVSRVFTIVLSERARQQPSPPPQTVEEASATAVAIIEAEEIIDSDRDCAICFEGFEEKQVCRVIEKCGHFFHKDCVDQWLTMERGCPLCRCFVLLVSDNSPEIENQA
ncbi:E3 ubiquitin-protein ligase RING1-like [Momordica charantia]|uniref:RING-type E3 ubiquitin transferase n=1 Tax=Momordica charantia TaxID=3673 RepID=A0A6J1DYV0_MOMCH|nr:E3 ubiquitin-protein ligase RING1-like [Momordica charantia]